MANLQTSHFGTWQDNAMPACPICGVEGGRNEIDGMEEYPCNHFVGASNPWFDADEYADDFEAEATHMVITSHVTAGQIQWYFKRSEAFEGVPDFSIKDRSSKPYAHMIDGVELSDIEDVSAYVGDYVETAIAATNTSDTDDAEIFAKWVWSGELEEAKAYIQSRIDGEKAS
jgi:hypothetical protein